MKSKHWVNYLMEGDINKYIELVRVSIDKDLLADEVMNFNMAVSDLKSLIYPFDYTTLDQLKNIDDFSTVEDIANNNPDESWIIYFDYNDYDIVASKDLTKRLNDIDDEDDVECVKIMTISKIEWNKKYDRGVDLYMHSDGTIEFYANRTKNILNAKICDIFDEVFSSEQ